MKKRRNETFRKREDKEVSQLERWFETEERGAWLSKKTKSKTTHIKTTTTKQKEEEIVVV